MLKRTLLKNIQLSETGWMLCEGLKSRQILNFYAVFHNHSLVTESSEFYPGLNMNQD